MSSPESQRLPHPIPLPFLPYLCCGNHSYLTRRVLQELIDEPARFNLEQEMKEKRNSTIEIPASQKK